MYFRPLTAQPAGLDDAPATSPFGSPIEVREGFLKTLREGLDAYLAFAGSVMHLADGLRRRVLANHIDALIAPLDPPVDEDIEFSDVLPTLDVPHLLIAGSNDFSHAAIEAHSRTLRLGTFITIEGIDHTDCEERADRRATPSDLVQAQQWIDRSNGPRGRPTTPHKIRTIGSESTPE